MIPHGSIECMTRFLEAYGKDMEFAQIELNYYDYQFQDAKGKVELLNKWNIPIWVMEPLRGGQLATLSEEDTAKLKAARPDEDVPAWALLSRLWRWLLWMLTSSLNAALTAIAVRRYVLRTYIFRKNLKNLRRRWENNG